MKPLSLILCALAVALMCVPAVPAFEVKSVDTNPPSDVLVPGQTVTVEATLRMTPTGEWTFTTGDTLKFQTGLDPSSVRWAYYIIIDNVMPDTPTTRGGSIIYIDDFELQYPSETDVKVRVILEGKAPEVPDTMDISLLKIQQLDSSSLPRTGSDYNYELNRTVVNPEKVENEIETRKAELDDLKTQIDEKSAMGVDVTAAMEEYNRAKDAIDEAESSSTSEAISHLNTAADAIDEALLLLDEAWTEFEINRAEGIISEVDENIDFFVNNRSMGNDARVINIITKRESAGQYLTSARDYFNQNEFIRARTCAADAYQKGMEAYNLSVDLREEVEKGFLPAIDWMLVLIGAVIVGVVGAIVIIWRRHNRWDELG
ncbi:MAG: hypothetical protein ACXQTN_07310 [Methanoculleaceae archaeon]